MKLWPLAAILALLVGVPGWAAEPADYRFMPGDVIEVTITPQRSFDRTVTVQPDGKISYPGLGQVQAAGLTVGQLAEKLRAGLNRDLINPRVTVTLKELNKQAVPRVSLLGAVRNPNVYPIKEGTTVAEALAAAGGPTPLADLRRVTVTRADRSFVTVDLARARASGRLDENIALMPGDLVVVPEGAPPTVLVLGEVTRPGSYEIQGEARLLEAISLAGGPTGKADLRRVTLMRADRAQAGGPPADPSQPGKPSSTQTLDLLPLLSGADPGARNVVLQPGDTILIGETEERVYVLGRVAKPDTYALRPNDRVLDLVAKSGGAASDGDLSHAVLVRRDSTGQPVPKRLDLERMMSKGAGAENELLRPGDVLFVPDKKTRRSAMDFANLLWPITGLVNLFR